MKIDVTPRQLQAFLSIAKLASFTRAAAVLHTTQSTLSAQIQELEHSLGVRLFDRNTRSVALTRAGEDLLPGIEQVLADLASVLARAKDVSTGTSGRVSMAALGTFTSSVLPLAIARFRRAFPGINVSVREGAADRVVALVRAREVDFGISGHDDAEDDIDFTPLLDDPIVAVMPRADKLTMARHVTLDQLHDRPLILMERISNVRRVIDLAYAAMDRIVVPAFEVTHIASAIGMVRAGLGVALVPASGLDGFAATDVIVRPIPHAGFQRRIGVLRARGRSLSPAAEAFIPVVRYCVKQWSRRKPRYHRRDV